MYKFIQKHDSEEKMHKVEKPKVFKRLQIDMTKKRQSQRVMSSYRNRSSKNSPFRNQKAFQTMRINQEIQKRPKEGIEIFINPNTWFDEIHSATLNHSRVESRYFCENAKNSSINN